MTAVTVPDFESADEFLAEFAERQRTASPAELSVWIAERSAAAFSSLPAGMPNDSGSPASVPATTAARTARPAHSFVV